MSDRERRIFDSRFRRATIAYDDFDQSLREIAKARAEGNYPQDWGLRVRRTMAYIRNAKVLLSKAISDANGAVMDPNVEIDEVKEIQRSVSFLNNCLQRTVAVEETLINTLFDGDADYTSLYLSSQMVTQRIEDRVRRTAYGEDSDDVAGVGIRITDDADDYDEEYDENEDDIEDTYDEPEEECLDTPEEDETEDCTISEEDIEESEDADDDSEEDELEIFVASDSEIPEPLSEPEPEPSPRGLTPEEKLDLIRSDAAIQRLIHDEAQRQANARFEAMVAEAVIESTPSNPPSEPRHIEITPSETPESVSEKERGFIGRIRIKGDDKVKEPRPSKKKTKRGER